MRKTTVGALLVTLVIGAACDAESGKSPGSAPENHPVQAPTAYPHNVPNHGADTPKEVQGPPVVNGDAGPENDSHFVVYQLICITKRETGGRVEYVNQNGQTIPVNVKSHGRTQAGTQRAFSCNFEHIEKAHLGIPMGFSWFPNDADTWAMCTLIYNGETVDYQVVPQGPCAVSFRVPPTLPKPKNP